MTLVCNSNSKRVRYISISKLSLSIYIDMFRTEKKNGENVLRINIDE